MKGEWVLKILQTIGNITTGFFDLADAMIKAGYGASQGQIMREINKIEQQRLNEEYQNKAKRKLEQYLNNLKNQGLIKEFKKDNKKFIFLTQKGKSKLSSLKKIEKLALPDKRNYKKVIDNKLIIVSFDIPESESRKRDWLRRTLIYLGFNLIHKSVWAGKRKVPENFLNDLQKLSLINYVEIFEITKKGTIMKKY